MTGWYLGADTISKAADLAHFVSDSTRTTIEGGKVCAVALCGRAASLGAPRPSDLRKCCDCESARTGQPVGGWL